MNFLLEVILLPYKPTNPPGRKPAWAQTRLAYGYDDTEGTMDIKWSTGDAFYMVDASGQTIGGEFSISQGVGSKSASFTGTKPQGTTFKAFYPYSRAHNPYKGTSGLYETWADCAFNVSGQQQMGDDNTAHLSAYNFMTITGEIDGENINEASLNFKHEVAIFRFEITLNNTNAKPKQLQLKVRETDAHSATGKHGFVIAQKAADGALLQVSRTICMDLKDINTNEFVAYMAVLPGTLKGPMSVEVYYNEDNGDVINKGMSRDITFANTTWEIEAGKIYHAKLEDGFTDISDRVFYTGINASNELGTRVGNPNRYVLKTAADLKHLIENHHQYGEQGTNSVYFHLEPDIHVTADEWKPIGTSSQPLVHTLTSNLITTPIISGKLINKNYDYFGFVGKLQRPGNSGSTIISLLHITADLLNKYSSPDVEVTIGSVVGQTSIMISNCSAAGAILPVGDSVIKSAGGLIGASVGGFMITNCINDCAIIYTSNYVGGIIGYRGGVSIPDLMNCKGLCKYPIGSYEGQGW